MTALKFIASHLQTVINDNKKELKKKTNRSRWGYVYRIDAGNSIYFVKRWFKQISRQVYGVGNH